MLYTNLGATGTKVSRICLGCGNFGESVDKEQSVRIIHHALDNGINFLDTSNAYGGGISESCVGEAIAGRAQDVVISTKVFGSVGPGVNDSGLSRRHIRQQVELSLERLGVETIDLYQLHQHDPATPIEESLSVLSDLVHAGKVHYTGCCNLLPAQLCEALWASERNNLVPLVSEQVPHNILDRRVEPELLPFAQKHKVGLLAFSPLARGLLGGTYGPGEPPLGSRCASVPIWNHWYGTIPRDVLDAVAVLREIAAEAGISLSRLALAWALDDSRFNAVIVGPRTVEHLDDALGALEFEITPQIRERIEQLNPTGRYMAG